MIDLEKFVEENQIIDKSKLVGQIVKRLWDNDYEGDLFLIFESGSFAVFHATRGYEDVDISFASTFMSSYGYDKLRDSKLISNAEYDEWDAHKQAADRVIAARKREINERNTLAVLKRKYGE